ncbi:MAG: site-2 protease family protein [Isosphaeraceae bacterium]
MTDSFPWTINLGRWGSTQIRIHLILVVYLALTLLDAAFAGHSVAQTAGWLLLLLAVLALHELGHALMAARVGLEPEDIRLWPLGNLIMPGPSASARTPEALWVAAAGPLTSLACAVVAYLGVTFADAHPVLNPFGYMKSGGAPFLADGTPEPAFTAVWWIGWFGYLNWVVFLANLVPALPMDMGRIFRGLVAGPWGLARDSLIAPYSAYVCALILGLGGVARMLFWTNKSGGGAMLGMAVMIYLMVRAETRMIEDGSFFDEGIFGYDFSQGYTSLDAGSAKVRPTREGALRRWRRRRSELRRLRREEKDAAEARRMDEILAKLYSQGRPALTDEENLFLVRVSARYRSRSKSHE